MMDRCYNPKSHAYRRYGGRGIKVCNAWHSPKNYCEYWERRVREGSDLQIDRIDNNGDYTPENCRAADRLTQMNNRECVKAVKCVETGKVYRSASEAQRQTGVWATGISSVVHGKRRTAGGLHWEYADR